MVSHDGFAKILDFGLAKLVDSADARAALQTMTADGTRPGTVMGTVGYMSPEQASGGPTDNRSDQFSFGLVLYEMLTGQRAFDRPTAVETLSAIIREDPPPVGQLNPSVPAPVRWIVDRCLAKTPADRYGSTRDLARDLASARDHFSELTSSGATAGAAAAPVARDSASVNSSRGCSWRRSASRRSLCCSGRPLARPADRDRTVRFTIAPPKDVNFTSSIGSSPFAVSPDGRHLAFVGLGSGKAAQPLAPIVRFARGAADCRDRRSPRTVLVARQSRRRVLCAEPAQARVRLGWRCRPSSARLAATPRAAEAAGHGIATASSCSLRRSMAVCSACRPTEAPRRRSRCWIPARQESAHVGPLFLPRRPPLPVFQSGGSRQPWATTSPSLDSPERKRVAAVTSNVDARLQHTGRPFFRARPHPHGSAVRPEPTRGHRGTDSRG